MDELVPPFFWIEGHDFDAYASMAEMARSVEVYDVGDLTFVDARGTRLTAATKGYAVTGFIITPGAPTAAKELESTLRHFIRSIQQQHPEYAAEARQFSTLRT